MSKRVKITEQKELNTVADPGSDLKGGRNSLKVLKVEVKVSF